MLVAPEPYRVHSFIEIQYHLSDRQYWKLLSCIWRRLPSNYYTRRPRRILRFIERSGTPELWSKLFPAPRCQQECFYYRPGDYEIYRTLPETITVFRGYGPSNRSGPHYSLSQSIAEEYATGRHGSAGQIDMEWFQKRDCIYIGGTDQEIIHWPGMGDVQGQLR